VSGAAIATVALRTRQRTAEARRKAFLTTVANHAVAIALAAAFILPLFFVVTTSLMSQQQALTHDLIPHPFQWRNYVDIFQEEPILRYGWNTFVYAGLATIGVVNPPNLAILCVDNGHYGETGYQKSHTSLGVDLEKIAIGAGIKMTRTIGRESEIADGARLLRAGNGTAFVLLRVKPTEPAEFKRNFDASLLRDRFRAALQSR